MVPRVGRCQDSAQCTRGSACISLSGASTATGPDAELGRAASPASVPPSGASAARSFGIGCRPPGDVGTGGQFAAVTLESGHCLPPREGRGIGRPGGPGCVSRDCRRARAGLGRPPAPACQRGRRLCGQASAAAPFVRVCHRDHGSGRRALLLYGDSERPARKHNDGRVALAALREESPMTDLIRAAQQGNGPRVEVAPLMVVAEFRGLGQLACCCRSVASTRQRAHPGFMVAAFILASSHRVLCRSSSTMPPRLAISQKSFAV